jgi:hypothetical protein
VGWLWSPSAKRIGVFLRTWRRKDVKDGHPILRSFWPH